MVNNKVRPLFLPSRQGNQPITTAAAVRCNYPDSVKVWNSSLPAHISLSCSQVWADRILARGAAGAVHQRNLVPAAGTSHLLPATVRTDNNRRVLIPFQLFRADLQSVAYQCGDKEQRRKSCGRASARFTQHPPPPFALLMVTFPLFQ